MLHVGFPKSSLEVGERLQAWSRASVCLYERRFSPGEMEKWRNEGGKEKSETQPRHSDFGDQVSLVWIRTELESHPHNYFGMNTSVVCINYHRQMPCPCKIEMRGRVQISVKVPYAGAPTEANPRVTLE